MPSYVIPPAGITAASFFDPSPIVDPASPPVILADAIDPQTRDLKSIFTGANPVDAAIQLGFTARRRSGPALGVIGNDFHTIRKVDDGTSTAVKNECRRITQRHVDARNISIEELAVDADTYPAMAAVSVSYRNLRTGKRGEVRR